MNNYLITYNSHADVLYITKKKAKSTSTIIDDNFIAIRKKGNEIISIVIDGFKDRHVDKSWQDSFIKKYLPDFNVKELPSI